MPEIKKEADAYHHHSDLHQLRGRCQQAKEWHLDKRKMIGLAGCIQIGEER